MGQNEYGEMLVKQKSLIQDEYYFKYIFKKTEKIVCAVFYVVQNIKDIRDNDEIVRRLKIHCADTLALVTDSLSLSIDHAAEIAEVVSLRLVALESQLRVLNAAGLLQADHLQVFSAEVDATLRSAKSYGWSTTVSKRETYESVRKTPTRITEVSKTSSSTQERTHDDRRSRILSVLKAQPGASIKDIVENVKDCSEKTVQRELNTLIKDGVVRREGERRWSTYSVL